MSPLEGSLLPVPPVASQAAQRRLAEALADMGASEDAARAIARASVDPADVRRRLAAPDLQRTSGATLRTVSATVWTPLVSVFIDNKRSTSERPLPIDGSPTPYPLLPDPSADHYRPELFLSAETPAQLSYWLAEAEGYLRSAFSLADRIGQEGILRPLTLAAMTVRFASGEDPLALLTSPDGSSRTSSAHQLLRLDPSEVAFRLSQDDRLFRRYVGEWRAKAQAGRLSEDEQEAVRALVAPADILVAVEARPGVEADTVKALRGFVGLLHVKPPEAWKEESQLDALGEEVLDRLRAERAISADQQRVLAGLVSLEEAKATGIVNSYDERAALILRTLVNHRDAVKSAIRRITHVVRVKKSREVEVAVELMMRAIRHRVSAAEGRRSRVAMQLAFSMPEMWSEPWQATDRSPAQLRDAALAELRADHMGPSTLELAIKGGYELARARVLAQISLRRGVEVKNLESPSTILRRLATQEHGIFVLHAALVAARGGDADIPIVDAAGQVVETPAGPAAMNADWLRETFSGRAGDDSPSAAYAAQQEAIRRKVRELSDQVRTLTSISDDAGPMMFRVGWAPDDIGVVIRRLERTVSVLRSVELAYRLRNHDDDSSPFETDEDLAAELEEDEL
jgi:hypothetical protein